MWGDENIDIELLINLVQAKPYLYNKQDKRYKDETLKENAWAEIGGTLQVESDTCISTWKSLKDKYTRERKKIKAIPSGSSCTIKPNWVWYSDLMFLDGYIRERRKCYSNVKPIESGQKMTTNITLSTEMSETMSIIEPSLQYDEVPDSLDAAAVMEPVIEYVQEAVTPTINQRTEKLRLKNTHKRTNNLDMAIVETLNIINKRSQSECEEEAFGQLVGVELSHIQDKDKRIEKKQKIMNILYSE